MYELIIAGAGPAGITAAVYAARKKLKTLLIGKDLGGQPNWTTGIENYLGYQYIEGPELVDKFWNQVKQFPIDIKTGQSVTKVFRLENGFQVAADDGQNYQGLAVIIATGKQPRRLNVPGEERLRGRGVTYCAICDGPVFQGQKVAVIGGGNSALTAAEDMIRIAQHIYLVSITPLTGDPILIDKVKAAPNITIFTEHQVAEIEGEALVEAVKIAPRGGGDAKRLEVGGVFVEIGLVPNSELVQGLVKLNEQKEIIVDCACETGMPGLFAAGDVTNVPEKQIIVAAGEGAKAALQAHRYLQRRAQ